MAPPPSQAGKFKPKKPGKRIQVGATIEASTTANNSSATEQDHASSSRSTGRGRGRGGGGGGGGGGRGGRGRGNNELIPQGQAFFTAAPAPTGRARAAIRGGAADAGKAAAARQTDPAATGAGVLHVKHDVDDSEEVVGELETAIGIPAVARQATGGTTLKPDPAVSNAFSESTPAAPATASAAKNVPSDDYMHYDSDSSLEVDMDGKQQATNQPLSLPFPSAATEVVPADVGGNAATIPASDFRLSQAKERLTPSPFAVTQNAVAAQAEQDSWFLVQLPTRLPKLVQHADPGSAVNFVDVATQPIIPGAFDNQLMNAVPGRLGKLQVYKSGKTVLVFEGPNGKKVHMNVSEGLSAGFTQQAVAIDPDRGDFVVLGNVGKTVVATPDLDRAFPEF